MLDAVQLEDGRLAYSIAEFAAAVGLSSQTIRNLVRDNYLTVVYPTASRSKALITREEGLRWLASLPEG
jgi:hypothetical protein